MIRYAAIDVGSNAVRLLIADIVNENNEVVYKKNTFIRVPLRLGEDSFVRGKISDSKINDLVKTLSAFKNLMDVFSVSDYLACATSAMREANNSNEIVEVIKQHCGLKLEVIGGEREANIISANRIEERLDHNKQYLYIDVGGGSTELSIFNNGAFGASKSFDVGTIRVLDNKVDSSVWSSMQAWIRLHCSAFEQLSSIGTGGNINKYFKLSGAKEDSALSIKKLSLKYNSLKKISLEERIASFGLNADRADVIIPAGEIFLKIMHWANISEIYVPKVGLADGMIKMLISQNQ